MIIRVLPRYFNPDDLLKEEEFTGYKESIILATKFRVMLSSYHFLIQFKSAGVNGQFPQADGELDSVADDGRQWAMNALLHRKFTIRLLVWRSANRFTGTIVGRDDGAVQFAIRKGYAQVCSGHADGAPTADLYAVAGIVTRTQGSAGVRIYDRPFYLYYLEVPFYCSPADCEPWGFEARELLRLGFIGQKATAWVVAGVPSASMRLYSAGRSASTNCSSGEA
jgi:hypothetical protein